VATPLGASPGRGVTPSPRPIVAFVFPDLAKLEPGLFRIDPKTGERLKRLTRGDTRQPMWSPDGTKVVYAKGFENKLEIWVVRADGAHHRQVTDNRKLDQWPSWAPASRKVVVQRYNADHIHASRLFIVRADGSGERGLTDGYIDRCPDWAPDGSRIAFDRFQGADIYSIKPNGSGLKQLTSGPGDDIGAKWSPDAHRILFTRSIDQERTNLYVMKRDGTNVSQVTNTEYGEGNYAWSPNGKRIAFIASDSIWVMKSDGSDVTRVAGNVGHPDVAPSWSRDGRRITYTRVTDDRSDDIWIAKADGSARWALTSTRKLIEAEPDWHMPAQQCGAPY
jgi:Tol biopolymer transport system component